MLGNISVQVLNEFNLFNTIGIQMNTDVRHLVQQNIVTVTVYRCYLLTVSVYPIDPFHFNCHACTRDWYMQFTGSGGNASAEFLYTQFTGSGGNASAEFLAECIVSVFP